MSYPGTISVYVNGVLAGGDNLFNKISALNFVGSGITVTVPAIPGPFADVGIATIRISENAGGGGGDGESYWIGEVEGIYYDAGNVAVGGPVSAGSTVLLVYGEQNVTETLSVGSSVIITNDGNVKLNSLELNYTTVTDLNFGIINYQTESENPIQANKINIRIGDETTGAGIGSTNFGIIEGTTLIASEDTIISGTEDFTPATETSYRLTTSGENEGTLESIPFSVVGTGATPRQFVDIEFQPVDYVGLSTTSGDLPFPVSFNGVTYSQIVLGRDSTIFFTEEELPEGPFPTIIEYSSSVPYVPKILISSGAIPKEAYAYFQTQTQGEEGSRTYIIRFYKELYYNESYNANIEYELVFYEDNPSQIDINFLNVTYPVLDENTVGGHNIFLGQFAGNKNTFGRFNNFIGTLSGKYNVSGKYNNFIGLIAGKGNTDGSFNNFIGMGAGGGGYFGKYSTFGGNGFANNFIGAVAGKYNTTGSGNIFIGPEAGPENTTGSGNIFIGGDAGGNNNTGDGNIFIGKYSGSNSSSGDLNIFIGVSAGSGGYGGYGGFGNISLGSYSGRYITNGKYNTIVGPGAGSRLTSGKYNNYIGYLSGPSGGKYYGNSTGSNNNTLGTRAGNDLTTGEFNIFVGTDAGENTTTGFDNTFIGSYSGRYNTSGKYNTFIGALSGKNNDSGKYNNFIGVGAGIDNTTGKYNNFIGVGAGIDNTVGDYNIYVGSISGTSSSSSNKVIIGSGAPGVFFDSPSPDENSQLAIGNVIEGQTNYWLVGDENYNVAIGTTTPATASLTLGKDLLVNGNPETPESPYGVILTSPSGVQYRVTVDDEGNLSSVAWGEDGMPFGEG